MRKVRIVALIIASIVIIFQLYYLDYNNFSWKRNASPFLSIFAMSMVLISTISSEKVERKKKKENK